jgi:hypothetical protein
MNAHWIFSEKHIDFKNPSSLAMDMSLCDTVWTGHGQGMDNQGCPRPAHPLTTLAHSSRRPARFQIVATIEYEYSGKRTPARCRRAASLEASTCR